MKKLLIWVVILGALAVGGYAYIQNGGVDGPKTDNASSTTKTPEVVNESTANDAIKNWKVSVGDGLSFSYPADLGTSYITPKTWPPAGYLLGPSGAAPMVCTAGGTETGKTGITASRVIGGHTYCVTQKSEGAAGSTYTNYAYAFEKDKQVMALIISLRFVQCANYPAAKKTLCEAERKAFNMDSIADKMAQSFKAGKIEAAPLNPVAPKGS